MNEGTDVEPRIETREHDVMVLTDRQLLEETVRNQREMIALVQQFVGTMQDMKPGDIFKALLGR